MRYQIGDAPKLTDLLLSDFTAVPQPAIEKGLERYLWRHAHFAYAEQLAYVFDEVRSGQAGHFVYHKKSGLIFARAEFGFHQLLLAHLAALHKTDFCREHVIWNLHQFPYADPMRQLADDFVREGYGLFLSSVSNGKYVTVGRAFAWEPLELAAFGKFERDVI
ncbi:hypothetical protein R70006_04777 [Paraburkholderia domus]|uniref:hypothetical protein n=1 Tax=Paraburkholderia domus TaxID=2793075 RepID=UPI001911A944|nr:hypothetical protein [Paraburkholderia domus]MBK5051687.1 hypothetical protein [Burkholderia sp. R-70006]CAE6789480.1 hypothetical protein R70006_04777 [Paraburkholderia domus]CAE6793457.1 hypothetical protein R75483_04999 [Paraburkholderia domus]